VFTFESVMPTTDINNVTEFTAKGIQLYGIEGNKAYAISLIAEQSKYDTFLAVFQRIADSFEVTSQEFTTKPISGITEDEEQTKPPYSYIGYSYNPMQRHSSDKSEQVFGSANIITITVPGITVGGKHFTLGNIAGALGTLQGYVWGIKYVPETVKMAGLLSRAGFMYYGGLTIGALLLLCWALCDSLFSSADARVENPNLKDYIECLQRQAGPGRSPLGCGPPPVPVLPPHP
jgi:hypothetical protein